MAFKLQHIVPWGRNFDEYRTMFLLTEKDLQKKIAGFGDGPASFNCEAARKGYAVTSFDPIYQFSRNELAGRIEEARVTVMEQMKENSENYVWTAIQNPDELEKIRMSAMKLFLADYEQGRSENRYIHHELPDRLPYDENFFDIGLSSHFLLMYTALGYDFHITAMTEMLRVCKEIRLFPVVDLDAKTTGLISDVIAYFQDSYDVQMLGTGYEFQRNANKLLVIRKKQC